MRTDNFLRLLKDGDYDLAAAQRGLSDAKLFRCSGEAVLFGNGRDVKWSAKNPRSANSSSTSRQDSEKRRYHPTANRMISGSNCRHLNNSHTEGASSISADLFVHSYKLATLPS